MNSLPDNFLNITYINLSIGLQFPVEDYEVFCCIKICRKYFLSEGHNGLIDYVMLKLFLLIRLIHRTLPEERNSGEINLRP